MVADPTRPSTWIVPSASKVSLSKADFIALAFSGGSFSGSKAEGIASRLCAQMVRHHFTRTVLWLRRPEVMPRSKDHRDMKDGVNILTGGTIYASPDLVRRRRRGRRLQ